MSESVAEFFVLFMIVAYSDIVNRQLRKFYFSFTFVDEKSMPFYRSFLILLIAFHIGLALATITCWILSFVPYLGFGAWNG